MKPIIFIILVIFSFPLFGQYNPDKPNIIRLGSSYGGFSGLELHLGIERSISPKQIIYGNIFTNGRFVSGLTLGYRYRVASYKWLEGFAGLGLRTEYFSGELFKRQYYVLGLQPNLELRMNLNKTYFISTGVQFNSLFRKSLDAGDDYFINALSIGVARRF